MDYDTDVLREELTLFGAAPGPIGKTTKKLYVKRLMNFQRNKELVATNIMANEKRMPGKRCIFLRL